MHQQVYEPPVPPRRMNRNLSATAEAAILTALAKEPAARFATGGAFVQALRQPSPPRRRKEERRTIPAWLRVASILGLLALGAILCYLPRPDPTPAPTATVPAPGPGALPTGAPAGSTAVVPTWTPSPFPSETAYILPPAMPTPDSFWQEIEGLLRRYQELKAIAIGPSHDVSQLPMVMRKEALRELEGAARWQ